MKRKKPRKLTLVRFEAPPGGSSKYPFKRTRTYVFIGELANMPGHAVVADTKSGKIISGYHTENFVELDLDEV